MCSPAPFCAPPLPVCVSPALVHGPQPSFMPCPRSCSCTHNLPPDSHLVCAPSSHCCCCCIVSCCHHSCLTYMCPVPPPLMLLLLQQQLWLCSFLSCCLHCCSPCAPCHLYVPLFIHSRSSMLGVVCTHSCLYMCSFVHPRTSMLV